MNDDSSFPDTSVRVKTDLMSLTQQLQHQPQEVSSPGGLALIVITSFLFFSPRPSQATDVAAEVKRKLDKKEKKRKKREKKQQELEANGGTNGDAEVKPLACSRLAFGCMFDLRSDLRHVVPSQCTTCQSSMTPNHWQVPDSGLDH